MLPEGSHRHATMQKLLNKEIQDIVRCGADMCSGFHTFSALRAIYCMNLCFLRKPKEHNNQSSQIYLLHFLERKIHANLKDMLTCTHTLDTKKLSEEEQDALIFQCNRLLYVCATYYQSYINLLMTKELITKDIIGGNSNLISSEVNPFISLDNSNGHFLFLNDKMIAIRIH